MLGSSVKDDSSPQSPSPCPCSSYPAAQKRRASLQPLPSQTLLAKAVGLLPLIACSAAAEVVEADGRLLRGPGDRLRRRRERLRRRDRLRRRRDRLRVRLAEPFRGMLKKCSSRFSCVYVCRYYGHIYKYPYISTFLISCGPAAPPLEQDARGGSRELLQESRHWAKTLRVRGQSSMSPPKLRKLRIHGHVHGRCSVAEPRLQVYTPSSDSQERQSYREARGNATAI